MRSPRPLADLLPRLAEKGGWGSLLEVTRLGRVWPDIVGEAVALHTRPERLAHGRLTVVVDSAPWLVQLSFFKGDILRKVRALLGEGVPVEEVFFVVGRLKPPPKKPSAPTRTLSPAEREESEAAVAKVPDEGVRDALLSLIQNGLRRGRRPL